MGVALEPEEEEALRRGVGSVEDIPVPQREQDGRRFLAGEGERVGEGLRIDRPGEFIVIQGARRRFGERRHHQGLILDRPTEARSGEEERSNDEQEGLQRRRHGGERLRRQGERWMSGLKSEHNRAQCPRHIG